jgi:hypothetical protein
VALCPRLAEGLSGIGILPSNPINFYLTLQLKLELFFKGFYFQYDCSIAKMSDEALFISNKYHCYITGNVS